MPRKRKRRAARKPTKPEPTSPTAPQVKGKVVPLVMFASDLAGAELEARSRRLGNSMGRVALFDARGDMDEARRLIEARTRATWLAIARALKFAGYADRGRTAALEHLEKRLWRAWSEGAEQALEHDPAGTRAPAR
jgi:hypothetical protein